MQGNHPAPRVLKHSLKVLIAHVLYAVGLLQIWTRFKVRHGAVVLTYHRVLSSEALRQTWSHPGMVVSRATFEAHLDVLRRHFVVMSLQDFATRVEAGGAFDRPACLITFDDGWHDTFSEAWPALLRRRLPAVVFLPADLVGDNLPFWREELGELLYRCQELSKVDPAFRASAVALLRPAGLSHTLDAAETTAARRAIRSAVHELRAELDGPWARRLVGALRELLGQPAPGGCDRLMTWEQVREMAADGVQFGGHGATHTPLTTLPAEDMEREIRQSMDRLEGEIGGDVLAFSYPNGDFNAGVRERVAAAGFRLSFSTRPGIVSSSKDPLALPRINVHQGAATAPLLLARIAGLF